MALCLFQNLDLRNTYTHKTRKKVWQASPFNTRRSDVFGIPERSTGLISASDDIEELPFMSSYIMERLQC